MDLNKIHSNSKDEWYTPIHILKQFGIFDLDVASNEYNSKRLGIDNYFSIDNSALDKEWYGKVWCNPPFTLKKEFIEKAREQVDKGNCDVYLLLPMSLETKVINKHLIGRCKIYLPNGRVRFETIDGPVKGTPNFASVVIRLTKDKCNEYGTFNVKEKGA